MPKKRLMTPGPTQVPEEALLALARQVPYHRTAEMKVVLTEALNGLKYAFQTKNDVIILTSSGTGAMEAAVANIIPRGGKAIVIDAGNFAERWANVCQAFGVEVIRHKVAWGEAVKPDDVADLLQKNPDVVAVFATLMETSTGVAHDIQALGQVVGPSKALFIVDGISGACCQECRTDEWGIDCLVVGSQKALMLPPGLAFITVSPDAWKQIDSIKPQAYYFDLKQYKKKLADPDTPWTPAHTLVAALVENLKLIKKEGIENIWAKSRLLGQATRAGLEALGLELYASRPADGVTACNLPKGVDGSAFLKKIESRFGVKVAGGQGQIKGKIFRIAHLGVVDELDIIGTLAAVEMVLVEMGQNIELGSATAAAMKVLAESRQASVAVAVAN
jgi:aspartate aminotransferase-like enzyme